ncbi:unnamed protein product [Dovyalis caffra]|uniref:Uncharacterized protein n=1 Tax=Dovyalis caffra TaxID=77055 RepID=A0AAV1QZP5_9ROSI|nr:unnamed protein product [Dovyalis caffra]
MPVGLALALVERLGAGVGWPRPRRACVGGSVLGWQALALVGFSANIDIGWLGCNEPSREVRCTEGSSAGVCVDGGVLVGVWRSLAGGVLGGEGDEAEGVLGGVRVLLAWGKTKGRSVFGSSWSKRK